MKNNLLKPKMKKRFREWRKKSKTVEEYDSENEDKKSKMVEEYKKQSTETKDEEKDSENKEKNLKQ